MITNPLKFPPLFLILLLLLAACGSPSASPATQTASSQPSEVVRTVVTPAQQGTALDECGYPVGDEGAPPCSPTGAASTPGSGPAAPATATLPAYPEQGSAPQATPAALLPNTPPTPTPTVPPAAPTAVPYVDCARAVGLPGCGDQAVPIPARLAFLDAFAPRMVGLDLQTGQGWQAQLTAQVGWLSWSTDGTRLLVSLPDDLYVLYSAEGSVLETFTSTNIPDWQPDGRLSLDGSVSSENGWRAGLVRARETRWDLHFRRGQEAERVLPLDSLPVDSFYVLRAWIPGTDKVLLQASTAGGRALFSGGQLLAADTLAATLTDYEVSAPLDSAAFAFNPARGSLLALLTSPLGGPEAGGPEGGGPEGGSRLALLDFNTNQIRYPLPDGVILTGMAWQPDGERLAFSIGPLAPNASEATRQRFSSPGIYLLEPQSGEIEALVQSPTAAQDGWPQWTADGKTLLYARTLPQQSGSLGVEIRARQPESGQDWLIIQGLPAPPTAAGRPAWNRVLSLGIR